MSCLKTSVAAAVVSLGACLVASLCLPSCSLYPTRGRPVEPRDTTVVADTATYTFTFVNLTSADMAMYVDNILYDTIPAKDSLVVTERLGSGTEVEVELESIVATDSALQWTSTVAMGVNFYKRYYAPDSYFLLSITNNSGQSVWGAVISNAYTYDSLSVYVKLDETVDLGYFRASSMTDIRFYDIIGQEVASYDDVNTTGADGKAAHLSLTLGGGPAALTYTLVNGTSSDLKMYAAGILRDTIPANDSLVFTEGSFGVQTRVPLHLVTIVAGDDTLYWNDTLVTTADFRRRYFAGNKNFLLRVANNSGATVASCVVSNIYIDDTSSVSIPTGTTVNVGYYRSSISTSVGFYDFLGTEIGSFDSMFTMSLTDEAIVKTLTLVGGTPTPGDTSYYTFVNDSWSDMKLYLGGVLVDTIPYQDSVWYWDTVSSPIKETVRLESIVLTDNFMLWADTFVVNQDYRQAYHVSGDWFLLYVTNSTNFPMDGAVVSSPLDYDSSSVLLTSGDDADVGYYTASSTTDIRLYFFSGTAHASYEDQNTISSDDRSKILSLEPDDQSLLMKRRAGGRAKSVPQREPAPLRHLGEVLAGHSP